MFFSILWSVAQEESLLLQEIIAAESPVYQAVTYLDSINNKFQNFLFFQSTNLYVLVVL